MHSSGFTSGSQRFSRYGTVSTALVGQCSEHAAHSVPSRFTTQRSTFSAACPTRVRCLSPRSRCSTAPVGQTSPQRVQSKLQKAFVKSSRGRSHPAKPKSNRAGCSTCVGHALTHRWQAVQRCKYRSRLCAPGGHTAVQALGSSAAGAVDAGLSGKARADATTAAPARNARRPGAGAALVRRHIHS